MDSTVPTISPSWWLRAATPLCPTAETLPEPRAIVLPCFVYLTDGCYAVREEIWKGWEGVYQRPLHRGSCPHQRMDLWWQSNSGEGFLAARPQSSVMRSWSLSSFSGDRFVVSIPVNMSWSHRFMSWRGPQRRKSSDEQFHDPWSVISYGVPSNVSCVVPRYTLARNRGSSLVSTQAATVDAKIPTWSVALLPVIRRSCAMVSGSDGLCPNVRVIGHLYMGGDTRSRWPVTISGERGESIAFGYDGSKAIWREGPTCHRYEGGSAGACDQQWIGEPAHEAKLSTCGCEGGKCAGLGCKWARQAKGYGCGRIGLVQSCGDGSVEADQAQAPLCIFFFFFSDFISISIFKLSSNS